MPGGSRGGCDKLLSSFSLSIISMFLWCMKERKKNPDKIIMDDCGKVKILSFDNNKLKIPSISVLRAQKLVLRYLQLAVYSW